MANNRVILTAGEAIKKEFELKAAGRLFAGMFVMPVAGGVNLPTAGYVAQIAILDFTSMDGMNPRLGDTGANGYNTGDQVPVLYPTNGCEVNVMTENGAIADGSLLAIAATGMVAVATDVTTAIGVARGVSTLIDGSTDKYRIKMEVLK